MHIVCWRHQISFMTRVQHYFSLHWCNSIEVNRVIRVMEDYAKGCAWLEHLIEISVGVVYVPG